ncbi:pre-mRNA-processing factor 39-like isoform X5 [Branchiostoma floridae x Branchiostoma japonicum]
MADESAVSVTPISNSNPTHPVAMEVPSMDLALGTEMAYKSASSDNKTDSPELEKYWKGAKEEEEPDSPELEKYWKVVKENPQDFTGWTYLLQYVEHENKLNQARRAFDAFFMRYPYCYGYWKKYADVEKKHGNIEQAQEVYERGLKAIPLSVDLWIHYINFATEVQTTDEVGQANLRSVYEKAVTAAGTEFRSDRLWDLYLAWELEQGNLKNITAIYNRLLNIPTQMYSHHFEKFKDHVNTNLPKDILPLDEFLQLRTDVLANTPGIEPEIPGAEPDDGPPGVVPPPGVTASADKICTKPKSVVPPFVDCMSQPDAETLAIRDKLISTRRAIYSTTEAEVSKRWTYEEGIKRPYFHVKPLERVQLKNWKEYLDFEMEQGSHERMVVLFERCMIACALYEDFWLKYAKYLESHSVEGARNVYRRACTIHLPRKPNIHLNWAAFEEQHGNLDAARDILKTLEEAVPGLAMVTLRRVSLERRTGNLVNAERIFQEAVENAKDTSTASFFSLKLARFLAKTKADTEGAKTVLKEAIEKDKENAKLYLQLLDLEFQQGVRPDEDRVLQCFDLAMASQLSADAKLTFSQRKVEFLEDFGSNVERLMTVYEEHQKLVKTHSGGKKRSQEGTGDELVPAEKKHKLEENGTMSMPPPMTMPPPAPAPNSMPPPDPNTAPPPSYNYNWSSGYNQPSANQYNYGQWGYGQQYYPPASQ